MLVWVLMEHLAKINMEDLLVKFQNIKYIRAEIFLHLASFATNTENIKQIFLMEEITSKYP